MKYQKLNSLQRPDTMSTNANFGPQTHCVLAFKGTDLFKLSVKNQQCLVNRINAGYDKIFKKYNIIK